MVGQRRPAGEKRLTSHLNSCPLLSFHIPDSDPSHWLPSIQPSRRGVSALPKGVNPPLFTQHLLHAKQFPELAQQMPGLGKGGTHLDQVLLTRSRAGGGETPSWADLTQSRRRTGGAVREREGVLRGLHGRGSI